MTQPEGSGPDAAPTVAEGLLLLLFQPDSGTIAGEGTLFYTLAGAVLAELALGDHVSTTSTGLGGVRVATVPDRPPVDAVLRSAWDYLADKPRGVHTALAAIGPRLRAPLLERLVERGELRREERKTLGLIKTTALVDGETGRRAALLRDVHDALLIGVEPPARIAALAALISASGTLPQFHRDIPWTSPVIIRAKELEDGNWGAGAAGEAVNRTVAAIVVNSVAVATAVQPQA